MTKFWDSSSWRSLSKQCHDRKTATHDGGFGNPRRGGQILKDELG
jgi:5-methylcytosine-specific restriction protein A